MKRAERMAIYRANAMALTNESLVKRVILKARKAQTNEELMQLDEMKRELYMRLEVHGFFEKGGGNG